MPQYLSPGVYVEEVDGGSRPIEGVGTAVAAFVGLADARPVQHPDPGQQLDAVHRRRSASFVAGLLPGARRLRLLPERRRQLLRRPDRRRRQRRRRRRSRDRAPARRRRPLGSRLRVVALDAGTCARASIERRGRRRRGRRGADRRHVQARRQARRPGRRGVRPRDDRAAASSNVATMVNAAVQAHPDRGRSARGAIEKPRHGRRSRSCRPRRRPRRRRRRLTADDYVGDVADRTGFGGLEAIDEVTMVAVPDLMTAYQQGVDRPRDACKAVQLGDDRPLRADGRPGRDPRPAAGPERPADQGVAGRQGRLRLEVRRALLAVDQGLRPGDRREHVRAAERPRGRHLGPQRRHPRRAQGAGQRGRPRRHRPRDPASPRASTTCSTRSASTASGRSPAAASGSGARARCRATRRGATSTSAGCSTTSRSRSSTAPSGWCSSRTTTRCGPRIRRTISAFLVNEWRKGALFGPTPDEAFFVKCDDETNPAEGIDAGQVVCEIGVAPVKPAEFVDLPAVAVLRRHQPGQPSDPTTAPTGGNQPWHFPISTAPSATPSACEFDGIMIKAIPRSPASRWSRTSSSSSRTRPTASTSSRSCPAGRRPARSRSPAASPPTTASRSGSRTSQFGKMGDARKGGAIIVFDYEGNADQALQAHQRLAQEPRDRLAQGRRHQRAHREARRHLRASSRSSDAPMRHGASVDLDEPTAEADDVAARRGRSRCARSSRSSCRAGTSTASGHGAPRRRHAAGDGPRRARAAARRPGAGEPGVPHGRAARPGGHPARRRSTTSTPGSSRTCSPRTWRSCRTSTAGSTRRATPAPAVTCPTCGSEFTVDLAGGRLGES